MKNFFPNLNPTYQRPLIDCKPLNKAYMMFNIDLVITLRKRFRLKEIYAGYYSVYENIKSEQTIGLTNTVGFPNIDQINKWIDEDGFANLNFFAYPIDEMDNLIEVPNINGVSTPINDEEFEDRIFRPLIRERFNQSLNEPECPIVTIGSLILNGQRHRTTKIFLSK